MQPSRFLVTGSRHAADIADTIMAALDMQRRALRPELAVFANNPWKE